MWNRLKWMGKKFIAIYKNQKNDNHPFQPANRASKQEKQQQKNQLSTKRHINKFSPPQLLSAHTHKDKYIICRKSKDEPLIRTNRRFANDCWRDINHRVPIYSEQRRQQQQKQQLKHTENSMGDNYNCTINDCHYTHYSVFVRHLHAAVLLVCSLVPFFGLLHHQSAYIYISNQPSTSETSSLSTHSVTLWVYTKYTHRHI